jgi:hypothetical protein
LVGSSFFTDLTFIIPKAMMFFKNDNIYLGKKVLFTFIIFKIIMLNFYGKKEFFEFICIFMCFCMDFGGLDVPWSSDSHQAFQSLIMIIF